MRVFGSATGLSQHGTTRNSKKRRIYDWLHIQIQGFFSVLALSFLYILILDRQMAALCVWRNMFNRPVG